MYRIKIQHLTEILKETEWFLDVDFQQEVHPEYLKGKGEELLKEVYESLGGKSTAPYLPKIKFPFKINRFVFLYDEEEHFNRYRGLTLKTSLYEVFSFPWLDSYKRLCRTYEKDCVKVGLQDRVWNGPPLASKLFGTSEEPGDLSGNGSSGWKLNAYNDCQYDLLSRLHGYKLIRIPAYETLMIERKLFKINDLLLNPKDEQRKAIITWLGRKML